MRYHVKISGRALDTKNNTNTNTTNTTQNNVSLPNKTSIFWRMGSGLLNSKK